MRFEMIPIEEVRKMGRGMRITPQVREQLDDMLKKLQETGTEGVRFMLDENERYTTWRSLLRKYAATKGINLLFQKRDERTFGCWIASEEEWNARPRVGVKPGASKGGRPPRTKK
jgi:hypothetical protein